MATRTVISTGVPQSIQRGILITVDQDQTQKDAQLDSKRPQQISPESIKTKNNNNNSSNKTNNNTNNNANNNKWNDIEVSTHRGEMSPTILKTIENTTRTTTTTFIDINRNNVQINDHYNISNSLSRNGGNDEEVKETKQQTASDFPYSNRSGPTHDEGERGKLALNIVASNNNNRSDDDDDGVHGELVGKSPIQMRNDIAPNEFDGSAGNGANEESNSRNSNGTTNTIITTNSNGNSDYDQRSVMKAFYVDIKKTIIQCNVEDNSITNGNDDNEEEPERRHNEESGNICGGDASAAAASAAAVGGYGISDRIGVGGQHLCNGLRLVDANGEQQAKLDDDVAPAAASNISRITKADCASAAKQTFDNDADHASHVIKIQIKPSAIAETVNVNVNGNVNANEKRKLIDKQVTVVQVNESTESKELNVNKSDLRLNFAKMVQMPSTTPTSSQASLASAIQQNGQHNGLSSGNTSVTELNVPNPTYLYYTMSSGQFSPCDTLDSGTGSDLESNGNSGTPMTLPTPKAVNGSHNDVTPKLEMHLKTTKIRITNGNGNGNGNGNISGNGKSSNKQNGEHQRASSLTDSEESESSSLSCDSLHSAEYIRQLSQSPSVKLSTQSIDNDNPTSKMLSPFLPHSLLRDIRDRKFPTNEYEVNFGRQEASASASASVDIETSVKTVNAQKIAEEAAEHAKFLQECDSRDNELTSNGKRASMPPGKTFILNSENGTFVDTKMNSMPRKYEADKYYSFHVSEHENFHSFNSNSSSGSANSNGNTGCPHDDETSSPEYDAKSLRDDDFAGYKDIRCSSATSTIRSSKGTVRGVKNRVRNGIATFLQMQQPHVKNFMEKDLGKVVLYTTSMGIIRETYAKCSNVKQILRTLLVKFEERDVFMSVEYQAEIKNRMHTDVIRVPQLFVEGQHIGDAETVERLNETGELRQLLKPYKSISTTYTCQTCGGYRLLPCPSCNGSKKSVHRNHFTTEFVALKCMNCDEVGLVKCHNC